MNAIQHEADFCVVGGGMGGLCAALSAARHGVKTVLMHDRPVLGGNASSECRVHICGADRHGSKPHFRETGILEELRLENLARNPNKNFSVWDTVLYEAARFQPNLTLLLNCSCLEAEMGGADIRSVTGWQLTTQTRHTVAAKIFADCSGDGILAPLTGADFRMGREARSEYGESIAPEVADNRTMGMTCLFQSREYPTPQPYEPPRWARRFDSCDEIPYGAAHSRWWEMGYWYVELGGEDHSIHDTERLRDELLAIALGVWDHIKNRCPQAREKTANWALEWLQFLPAKRESRRFMGDHVLTQGDIESEGRFADIAAYGGWSMDDHHPAGFRAVQLGKPATIFHPTPPIYGIPYRCLYSRNIGNLMFAGRNASCTHAAMSATRVMGTCCSMGQAVGTAAAMSVARGCNPRDIGGHMDELQQKLLADDCYLPWTLQRMPELTHCARLTASRGDPEPVRDGIGRQVGDNPHCWISRPGDWIAYEFDSSQFVNRATLVLDSAMDRIIAMSSHQKDNQLTRLPDSMPKRFRIEGLIGGKWQTIRAFDANRQRLVRLPISREVSGLRYVLEETWGEADSRLYAFYVE
ncbi:MAG TPA: FAD-dependent oxidoreductase [Candidatus Brocadiia bacterium]|nr:FAD-dependent oxidoreductase [Candidatus Brocadiia bacterium]